jgi:predicted nucleic acid-binding protein
MKKTDFFDTNVLVYAVSDDAKPATSITAIAERKRALC